MKLSFKYIGLFLLLITIGACSKKATVTVTVTMQSAGQPVVTGANIGVMLHSIPDSANFQGKIASAQGIVVFENVANGNYYATAEHYDGSKILRDSKIVQVQNGHDADVTLLLQ